MSRIAGPLGLGFALMLGGLVLAQAKLPLSAFEAGELPTLAPVLAKVSPSVVALRVEPRSADGQKAADRARRRSTPAGETRAGSGVIFDAGKGLIVTNNHVLGRFEELAVIVVRGRRLQATLVGADPETDLAVIKVPADDLAAISLGDSNQLRIGDFVVAIGVPFPIGRTMTAGSSPRASASPMPRAKVRKPCCAPGLACSTTTSPKTAGPPLFKR